MDFAFSEEQEMLRRSARDVLAKECPPKVVRKLMEGADAYDPALWSKIAALGAIASGSARATLAFTEPSARWDASGIALTATPGGGGWRLDGVKLFVPDANSADYMVVAARTRGEGEDGISLFLVEGTPKGMSVHQLETLDMTRRWCEVRFDGVELPADSLMGAPHKAWPALKRSLEWATAALCAEMVGGAQKVLETSTDYAKTRHQFGKPIGIYQAVSHKLADMLVLSESGRSATYYAAWAVDADAPDRSLASSMAKAYVSDAYRKVAGDGIQVHGRVDGSVFHSRDVEHIRLAGQRWTAEAARGGRGAQDLTRVPDESRGQEARIHAWLARRLSD